MMIIWGTNALALFILAVALAIVAEFRFAPALIIIMLAWGWLLFQPLDKRRDEFWRWLYGDDAD